MTKLPDIFCAVDTPDMGRAIDLARIIAAGGLGLKLGLEFFNAQGPHGVRQVLDAAPDVPLFLDLKYHDIPNTVAQAVRAAVALKPAYLNVHAAGGLAMMRAAQDAARAQAAQGGIAPPKLLAVTALTSLSAADLQQTGVADGIEAHVLRLAKLAQAAQLDGVVCSAHEIAPLRAALGPDFILMVPGIRPAGSAANDQSRVMTPREALAAGATHLVIGRPITAAPDPAAAIAAIRRDIA